MVHIIGAMAEFERELIKERVREGIKNAKEKGKRHGRKPIAPITNSKIIEEHIKNPELLIRQIAKIVKIPHATVHKTLKNFRDGKLDKDGFRYVNPLV